MSESNFGFLTPGEQDNLSNKYESFKYKGIPSYFDVNELEMLLDRFLAIDDAEEVKRLLRLADKLHPGDIGLKLRKAKHFFSEGKLNKAWSLLNKIEAIEKSRAEVFLIKGMIQVMNKQFDDADALFEKAVTMAGGEVEDMYYTIATTLETASQYKAAIKYFKKAYELSGTDDPELLYDLAFCFEKSGDTDTSNFYYKKYLDINPFSETGWYNLAVNYHNTDNFEKSHEAFKYALTVTPDYLPAILGNAENLMKMGRYEECIRYYKIYIDKTEPYSGTFTEVGHAYRKLGSYKFAITYYHKALEHNNKCADAHYGLGLIKYNEDKYLESITHFKTALKHATYDADYWYSLGISYRKLGFSQKAQDAFERALDLYPYDPDFWVSYADMAFLTGEVKLAIEVLTRGEIFNQNTARIKYRLAAYYLEAENKSNAISYFSKALRLNANESNDFFTFYPKAAYLTELRSLVQKKL
ncbi:MAG: tetratricopeptide repeat protein [Bacteroidales bacterium]